MGPERAARLLACGANDMGGSLMNESITRAAGAPAHAAAAPGPGPARAGSRTPIMQPYKPSLPGRPACVASVVNSRERHVSEVGLFAKVRLQRP